MLIGKTHTGKTTFANELKKSIAELIILEADPIAVFMKEKFPDLREADDKDHTGSFEKIALKFRAFLLFVEFALDLGKPIVLSNSNMWVKGRALVLDLCKKFDYNTIGIYLDLPEDLLMERVNNSDKSKDVLRISNNFSDLVINQRSRMQVPNENEFDEFIVVKTVEELENIIKELLKFYETK